VQIAASIDENLNSSGRWNCAALQPFTARKLHEVARSSRERFFMMSLRRLILSVFILSFATALADCGDTWRGVKKDTGENMEKSGDAVSGAGKKVQP
jgi:hypothetical protein